MINIKDFDLSLLKIDKKSYENIGIYNIWYIIIEKTDDYENIRSVNPFYLMISEVIEHMEEKNGNKYLVFNSSDENKEVLKNTQNSGMGLKTKLKS